VSLIVVCVCELFSCWQTVLVTSARTYGVALVDSLGMLFMVFHFSVDIWLFYRSDLVVWSGILLEKFMPNHTTNCVQTM